jgi:hypothetical protein
MSNDPTVGADHTGNGPWRLLILDHDLADPKWIVATVTTPADVRPAVIGGGGVFAALAGARTWVRGLLGRPGATLVPLHRAEVWQIDETAQVVPPVS